MSKIVIIGAGGLASEIADIFFHNNNKQLLGYIIDPEYGNPGTIVNNLPVLGDFSWLEDKKKEVKAIIGIGNPKDRKIISERLKKLNIDLVTIIHKKAIITKEVRIGKGVIITAGCVLTNNITIKDNVLINLNSTIGHDCIINEHVVISPGSNISGKVIVNEGCYIGTNSTILEKLIIGEWSIIGAGSVIIQDVPENTTIVGNPGRVIKTRLKGWQNG